MSQDHHEKRMEALSASLSMDIDGELFRAIYDVREGGMYIDRKTNLGWVPLQENDDWRWLFKYMRDCFANLGLK
jgi:hypothetical protein